MGHVSRERPPSEAECVHQPPLVSLYPLFRIQASSGSSTRLQEEDVSCVEGALGSFQFWVSACFFSLFLVVGLPLF